MRILGLVGVGLPLILAQGDRCAIDNVDKWDCGIVGTDQTMCEADGCCWEPVLEENMDNNTRGIPWCFHSTDDPNPCGDVNWAGTDPGFTDEYYNIMYENYLANLNIDGSGAVVAAPDQSTPGGSYYYHWMRDAGLSIKAWLDINDNDYATVKPVLDAYAGWVKKVQHKSDPNDIDVRIEPKFEIPSGDPYTGGWCRPQTDGPALRGMAMSKWGMILANTGQGDPEEIWDIVSYDMEWVEGGWEQTGCDLWEEVRSDDFYFNRMAYVYSLNVAADFGEMIGKDGSAYRALADEIKAATKPHFKDGFIYESTNRPYDGAVIHSIATFGQYLYPPESEETAATISVITRAFCQEYPVNQEEMGAGEVGILIGRYPGDSYAGGNPWQLLTAVLAEVFYLGGQATYRDVQKRGDYTLNKESNKEWMKLLKLKEGSSASHLAAAQVAAGDAVMTRLFAHVQDADGRVDEQIDKHTGKQASAEGLTWSYANILHALHVRKNLDPGQLTTTPKPTGGPTDAPTAGTTGTGPTAAPTTPSPNPGSCCNIVKFVSAEGINANFPNYIGRYSKVDDDENDRGIFKKTDGNYYLHYVEDLPHKFEAWIMSEGPTDEVSSMMNDNPKDCPDAEGQSWAWLNEDHWEFDSSAMVQCDEIVSPCCKAISVSSTGGVASKFPEFMGSYSMTEVKGKPAYQKGDVYLFFLKDVANHVEGWTISKSLSHLGSVASMGDTACPDAQNGSWEYIDSNSWVSDPTLSVTCA